MPSADFCVVIRTPCDARSSAAGTTAQTSRGKIDRLRRTPAGFTTPVLDDLGLRDHLLARPTGQASLFGSCLSGRGFAPRLRGGLRSLLPPSGLIEDLHLRAVDYARHKKHPPVFTDGCISTLRRTGRCSSGEINSAFSETETAGSGGLSATHPCRRLCRGYPSANHRGCYRSAS
jgi:hypothetical protein